MRRHTEANGKRVTMRAISTMTEAGRVTVYAYSAQDAALAGFSRLLDALTEADTVQGPELAPNGAWLVTVTEARAN